MWGEEVRVESRREQGRRMGGGHSRRELFRQGCHEVHSLGSAEAENERLTAELEKQKQQVATLVEQDAKREVEQQRLFDTLSELLGRMHYLSKSSS